LVIVEGEIQNRYTHPSNPSATVSDPNTGLGGIRTNNTIASDTSQNVFDNVSGTESRDGSVEYRCIMVYNSNSLSTLTNARIWFSQNTISSDDEIDMCLGRVAVGTDTTEPPIGTETTAPTDGFGNPLVFTHPTSGTPLVIGDIPNGQQQPIWFRRTVNAGGGAQSNNTFAWAIEGEST
jgi:hypothetical protein